MKNSIITLLFLTFFAFSCKKESLVQVQGHWNVVRIVIDDQPIPYNGTIEFNEDFTFAIISGSGSLINDGHYTLEEETVLTFYYNDQDHDPIEEYDIVLLTSSELIIVDREYNDRYELERR